MRLHISHDRANQGKVYFRELPSYFSAPNMPHDGYLAEFLMKAKGFVRSSRP